MADLPRSNMIKVRLFQKIKILKFDKMKSVQFFPLILWYVWGQHFDFLRKKDQFWTNSVDSAQPKLNS